MASLRTCDHSVLLHMFRGVHDDNKRKALLALEAIDAQSIITDIKNRYADVLIRALREECSAIELTAAGVDLIALINDALKQRMIRALTAAGVDVNITDTDDSIALWTTVFKRRVSLLDSDRLLRQSYGGLTNTDVFLDMTYSDEWVAFLNAVYKQRAVCELIAVGADVNMTDDNRRTALFNVIHEQGKRDCFKLIDPDPDASRGKAALFNAVQQCTEYVVRALIDAGADVNITDEDGKTALFHAIHQSTETVVRALIDAGADVNITDKDGKTALFYALQQSTETLVRALIDAGADVNMADEYGKTALFHAVQQSNSETMVRALIDAGADVNITDTYGNTALFHAVQQDNSETVVRVLIAAGAHVNITDKDGKTALFHAVQQDNSETVVRVLIVAGAHVNITDKDGKTALFHAVQQDNSETVVRALIDAGADVNISDEDGNTALLHAVQKSNSETVVRALIDAGAEVNFTDFYGYTALIHSVRHVNNESAIHALLDVGAGVNITDRHGCTALFHAVQQNGNEHVVRALIDAGADVNISENVKSTTPLIKAIEKNIHGNGTIRALIDAGTNLDAADVTRQTALFYAVQQNGNESVVRALIDAGADINTTDGYGKTALDFAVQQSNSQTVVSALIDAGADPNISSRSNYTVLLHACRQFFNESVIAALIDAGAHVNMADEYGKTALFHAVQQSNSETVVRSLIDAGADVNITDTYGNTALFHAIKQSNSENLARALIDAGAYVNVTDKDGKTPLFHAVQQRNNENVVHTLIDARVDVNITDKDRKTAIFYAVQQRNNKPVVSALINAGATVNHTDKYGKTALFYAALLRKNKSVVRALIDAGADVNITDEYGKTALFYALEQNNYERVCVLIDTGADVNMTDKEGRKMLIYAVKQSKNDNVILALIDAGADVNATDKDRRTALFYAVQQSNKKVVRALIDAGAHVNVTDKNGKTPLFHAVQSCNETVARALIEAGADIMMGDEDGKTALFHAVQQSDVNVIPALVGSVDAKDKYGRTAHFYVDLKKSSALDCLLNAGGNEYLKMKDNCDVDILSFLLDKWVSGKDLSFTCKNGILDVMTKQGMKRELIAKAIVNFLFLKSIDVFKKQYYKSHFWFRSNQSLLEEKLQALEGLYHENIGDESLDRNSKMQTILKALKNGFQDIAEALKLLAELGADPDTADSDGNTALHHVTRLPLWGVPHEIVMDLCSQLQRLRFGTHANKRNHLHQTALLFCLSADMRNLTDDTLSSAVKTLVQVCMFLVKQGSSMDETSRNGESVFHLMIKFFERCLMVKDKALRKDVLREAMKLLQLFPSWKVAKENIINKPDATLNSPLHRWASLSSSLDYVKSVSEEDLTFKTLLQESLKYMLECGANVNARNENDETPLHLCKTWTAVKLLIDAGANVKTVDSTGSSILLVAAKKGYRENSDHFYPDVTDDPKAFWTTAVQMGLDPWTGDKNDESVLGILVRLNAFVLAKALVDVACEQGFSKSKKVAVPLLNAICKDESTRSRWKAVLVRDILKSRKPTTASTPLQHCCRNIIDVIIKKTDTMLHPAAKNSVHCEIANLLRCYGAHIDTPDSSGKSCKDIAHGYPSLIAFLTKPLDITAVPIVIPWTSTSTRYEDKMAKVARRQQCQVVDQIWYHRDKIGTGSFGLIFAGINEKDGREVAIKRIEKLRMHRPEDRREIKNLTTLADCEQVVRYISFYEDKDFSHIVLELMEGNLEEYLKGSTTDASQATLLCKDVVMGLNFLHQQKILHRDLKPQNILYKFNPERVCLKIADFGLSRRFDSVSTTVYPTCVGTKCWIPPEVLNPKPNEVDKNCFKSASDMFSCGLIIHYILSGQKHPFQPSDCTNKSEIIVAHETEDNLMKGNLEGWDNTLCPEATHLVKRMLDCNEKARPSAEEALEHPFFWLNEKKIDFLEAVGNQKEFECPRSKKKSPLTPVETALEMSFSNLIVRGKCKWPWDDSTHAHMPDIYAGMTTGKGRKHYDTWSAVELVRFIRNVYEHYREKSFATTTPIEQLLFDDFVFLEDFADLVVEAYKAVTKHGWDKRDDIKSVMNKK